MMRRCDSDIAKRECCVLDREHRDSVRSDRWKSTRVFSNRAAKSTQWYSPDSLIIFALYCSSVHGPDRSRIATGANGRICRRAGGKHGRQTAVRRTAAMRSVHRAVVGSFASVRAIDSPIAAVRKSSNRLATDADALADGNPPMPLVLSARFPDRPAVRHAVVVDGGASLYPGRTMSGR